MIGHILKAAPRAGLVACSAAIPSLILPAQGVAMTEAVVLAALVAGGFTLAEYAARSPGLIEFRDAPPYNRIRFALLLASLVTASMALAPVSALAALLAAVGTLAGEALDVAGSPLRMLMASLPAGLDASMLDAVRMAGALALLCSAAGVAAFALVLRLSAWPGTPNLWTALPTFDAGGDAVAARLRRDGTVNLALGAMLPYVTPPLGAAIGSAHGLSVADGAVVIVWIVALWAFLPAALMLRGLALRRVAALLDAARPEAAGAAPAAA